MERVLFLLMTFETSVCDNIWPDMSGRMDRNPTHVNVWCRWSSYILAMFFWEKKTSLLYKMYPSNSEWHTQNRVYPRLVLSRVRHYIMSIGEEPVMPPGGGHPNDSSREPVQRARLGTRPLSWPLRICYNSNPYSPSMSQIMQRPVLADNWRAFSGCAGGRSTPRFKPIKHIYHVPIS